MSARARKIALSIGSCENFLEVVNGGSNECSDVVNWQHAHHDPAHVNRDGKVNVFHRPEPWAGNISTARLMFMSSNPSFEVRESFPTFQWPELDVEDFFMNRFSADSSRRFGATDGPTPRDFDRAILRDGSRTKQVPTWKKLRSRASILLDQPLNQTLASRDYVMSEVVHCKSRKEVGVTAALPICVSKWLKPVLSVSSARLIVVSGTPAGVAVKQAISELTSAKITLGSEWGSWKGKSLATGKWPPSWSRLREWRENGEWGLKDQENHIQEVTLDLDGASRKFTFMWMPHPIRSVPQKLDDPDLYDPRLLQRLRDLVCE